MSDEQPIQRTAALGKVDGIHAARNLGRRQDARAPGPLKTKQGLRPKDQMDAAMLTAAIAAMRKPR